MSQNVKITKLMPQETTQSKPTKEGWEKHWEKINKELYDSGGVNPHAYRLGFLDAQKILETMEKSPNNEWKVKSHTSSLGETGDYETEMWLEDKDGRMLFAQERKHSWDEEELQEMADQLNNVRKPLPDEEIEKMAADHVIPSVDSVSPQFKQLVKMGKAVRDKIQGEIN